MAGFWIVPNLAEQRQWRRVADRQLTLERSSRSWAGSRLSGLRWWKRKSCRSAADPVPAISVSA